MEVIELSREVREDTHVLHESSGYTDPPTRFEEWTTIPEKGYAVTNVHMGLHAGTHCDASVHYVEGGHAITDYPVQSFIGPAVVFELPPESGADATAMADGVQRLAASPEGIAVVRNTRESPLTHGARAALADARPKLIVTGAGWNIDEAYADSDFFHRADIPLIMNPDLGALDMVRDGDLIIALPLRLMGLEASPVRLVAIRSLMNIHMQKDTKEPVCPASS